LRNESLAECLTHTRAARIVCLSFTRDRCVYCQQQHLRAQQKLTIRGWKTMTRTRLFVPSQTPLFDPNPDFPTDPTAQPVA